MVTAKTEQPSAQEQAVAILDETLNLPTNDTRLLGPFTADGGDQFVEFRVPVPAFRNEVVRWVTLTLFYCIDSYDRHPTAEKLLAQMTRPGRIAVSVPNPKDAIVDAGLTLASFGAAYSRDAEQITVILPSHPKAGEFSVISSQCRPNAVSDFITQLLRPHLSQLLQAH